jgi:hypothetical protein
MSDRYHSWRDIGMGPTRREPLIKNVIGNFDFNNEVDNRYTQPKGCPFCAIVLTYSDKIKKHFCCKCGHPLTEEDRRILDGRDPPIKPTIDKQRVLPNNNEIEIDSVGSTADAAGGIRKNEEGFSPMKRGANSDVVTSREQADGIGSGYIKTLPSKGGKKSNLYQTPSGKLIPLDPDRQNLINSGKLIIDANDIIPESTGSNQFETVTPSELRMRESPEYRDRFRHYEHGNDEHKSGLQV